MHHLGSLAPELPANFFSYCNLTRNSGDDYSRIFSDLIGSLFSLLKFLELAMIGSEHQFSFVSFAPLPSSFSVLIPFLDLLSPSFSVRYS